MPFGPYGQDPYGHGAESFPAAPKNLLARPGLQGPQVVLTWDLPDVLSDQVMVRRKLREFPRDAEDGVLVLLDDTTAATRTFCDDLGPGLLPADAEMGEGVWWYYQVFVKPAELPLAEQFAGRGQQVVTSAIPWLAVTQPIDVQDARRVTIYLENEGEALGASLRIETAPEEDGPWVSRGLAAVLAGGTAIWESRDSMKYLRVRHMGPNGTPTRVSFAVDRPSVWVTGPALSYPCYVFKTGRHLLAAVRHLPEFYLTEDGEQPIASLFEAQASDGETHNLGLTGQSFGPLVRFLMVLTAEFDRVDAYLRSLTVYAPDVDRMPPQQFAHVALMLGYPLEVDLRNLEDVRAEIFRIAGVWKSKGTSNLVAAVCSQIFGVRPRVQEGAGRVLRCADPDLYDRVSPEDQQIGG